MYCSSIIEASCEPYLHTHSLIKVSSTITHDEKGLIEQPLVSYSSCCYMGWKKWKLNETESASDRSRQMHKHDYSLHLIW